MVAEGGVAPEGDGDAGPAWVRATDEHELALVGADVACRNAKGRVLKSVPKAAKETEAYDGLVALRDWLVRHEAECVETLTAWVLGSLPVPVGVLVEVWPDPAWQAPLRDAVVVALDEDGSWRTDDTGFLRGADAARGLGIVDLDGESRWLDPATVTRVVLPHPVLLDELDELRAFAVELDITQVLPQLQRQTYAIPPDRDPTAEHVHDWADARFAELRHATSRATSLGYRVRGGYACARCFEDGRAIEARYWIGADAPDAEAWTGDLIWVDGDERGLRLGEVGPVAWSEGVRMATAIHAGRVVDQEEGE